MKIIGHRGVVSFSPENSLSSLNYIKSLKLNWVECDVILSKDKIPVVFHDKKLDRITNYKGEVKNYKYKELENVDIDINIILILQEKNYQHCLNILKNVKIYQ